MLTELHTAQIQELIKSRKDNTKQYKKDEIIYLNFKELRHLINLKSYSNLHRSKGLRYLNH